MHAEKSVQIKIARFMGGSFFTHSSSCCRDGYKRDMKDKHIPDRSGELYQDAFTENESKPRGAVREEVEDTLQMDPNVDSEEADRFMHDHFGRKEAKQ